MIITYSLDTEKDDKETIQQMAKATEAHLVIWDVFQHLREREKYGNVSELEMKAYDDVRACLVKSMEEYGVSV